jgi:4-oxalocrotonate tautomerase
MPNIVVELFQGRSLEQRRAFAQAITTAAKETLDVEPVKVRITFREMSRDDVAVAGELVSDRERRS